MKKRKGKNTCPKGEDGRPYIKLRRKQTIGRNKKEAEEICRPEGEGEEYLSEGEDGRPCIKWRKQRTTNPTGREKETIEKGVRGRYRRRREDGSTRI